jgi:hypothetical protein
MEERLRPPAPWHVEIEVPSQFGRFSTLSFLAGVGPEKQPGAVDASGPEAHLRKFLNLSRIAERRHYDRHILLQTYNTR